MTGHDDPWPETVRRVVADPLRLNILHSLEVLDSAPDADFDRVANMAARALGVPYAQISLIEENRQWYRACHGIDLTETAVEHSFCAHTIAATESDHLIVLDAFLDERFSTNPFVTGAPGIRFYCGIPIEVRGQRIGSLCVLDTKPWQEVPDNWLDQLNDLAGTAASLFDLKDESRNRARTTAALMREEWRHALTLEVGKAGSWVWDIQNDEVTCNETFRRLYGLEAGGKLSADDVLSKTHPEDLPNVAAALGEALESGDDYEVEARVGGDSRWIAMRGRVYQRDAEGRAQVMMGLSIDVTESKSNSEHMRMLLRELNHRVKNTLAMIQSVARQTLRGNPDPAAFLEAFTGRLRTISDAHVLLADRDWSGIQLYEIVAAQLGDDFLIPSRQIEVTGRDVMLPPDHALGLGLILHELTTNAHRYGALSWESGQIDLRWTVENGPRSGVRLVWRERGVVLDGSRDFSGLGTKLIERSLSKVLDSSVSLDYTPDGVRAEIWVPLPAASHF